MHIIIGGGVEAQLTLHVHLLTLADCLVRGIGVLREEVPPSLEDLAGKVVGLQLEL